MAFATHAPSANTVHFEPKSQTLSRSHQMSQRTTRGNSHDPAYISEKLAKLGLDQSPAVEQRTYRNQQQQLLQQLLAQQIHHRGHQTTTPAQDAPSALQRQQFLQQQQLQQRQQLEQLQLQRQLELQQFQYQQQLQAQLYAVAQSNHQSPSGNQPYPADPRLQAQLLINLQAQQEQLRQQQLLQALLEQRQQQASTLQKPQNTSLGVRGQPRNQNALQTSTRQPHTPTPSGVQGPATIDSKHESTAGQVSTIPTEPSPSVAPVKTLGRFAQARQQASTPFGELTSLLARRSAEASAPTITTTASSPTEALDTSATRLDAREALKTLGHGRTPILSGNRSLSNPVPAPTPASAPAARSVSTPIGGKAVKPIRQPLGPPAPVDELGDRNFQSMVRKKAGKGLDMLGRREEKTPVLA